jgi:hypothetical protein
LSTTNARIARRNLPNYKYFPLWTENIARTSQKFPMWQFFSISTQTSSILNLSYNRIGDSLLPHVLVELSNYKVTYFSGSLHSSLHFIYHLDTNYTWSCEQSYRRQWSTTFSCSITKPSSDTFSRLICIPFMIYVLHRHLTFLNFRTIKSGTMEHNIFTMFSKKTKWGFNVSLLS